MTQTSVQPGHLQLMDLDEIPSAEGMRAIVEHAVRLQASDLFVLTNEQHVAVMVRYLGMMEPLAILSPEQGHRYISHIRAEAGMDLLDHRRPQDGRWIYHFDDREPVDLRISILPTLHGADMAIRLLVRDTALLSLDRVGMSERQLQDYRTMIERPGGLVLITGPTGSGKTVSLYASLIHLNNGQRKLHTIEDPIEYAIDGLRQSKVDMVADLSPTALLRGVLRQSPDVIMIGEIRDAQTAETALGAANSGVLVLATIHASDAAGAIQSLRGFGVSSAFIASGLLCICNSRLMRSLCPECREVIDEGMSAREAFKEIESTMAPGDGMKRYAARGCAKCYNTGYGGRVGVFELMTITEHLREMIVRGRSARRIRCTAFEEGFLPLRGAALLKAAQGVTTLEEISRAIPTSPAYTWNGKKRAVAGRTDGEAIVWR